jgi:hypothetical protein
MTRPDIANSVNLLSYHLLNPSPLHREQADHIIAYLRDSKYYAIEYSGGTGHMVIDREVSEPVFKAASDAAYADDRKTRKSSEGFIFSLYGGPIDWRATKQKVVTTSTTEAELVSAAHAAKELMWWDRFFEQLEFDPGAELVLFCDNKQTVDLLNKKRPSLATALRHVDVNQHWLRQEVQKGSLAVEWLATDLMPADGLTKPLPAGKHEEFVRLIRLRNKAKDFAPKGAGKKVRFARDLPAKNGADSDVERIENESLVANANCVILPLDRLFN